MCNCRCVFNSQCSVLMSMVCSKNLSKAEVPAVRPSLLHHSKKLVLHQDSSELVICGAFVVVQKNDYGAIDILTRLLGLG